jgi:hypothetical protein
MEPELVIPTTTSLCLKVFSGSAFTPSGVLTSLITPQEQAPSL